MRDVVARGQKVSSSWSSTIIRVKWLAEDNTNCWDRQQQQGLFCKLFHSDYYAAAAARNLQDSSNYLPNIKVTPCILIICPKFGSWRQLWEGESLIRRKACTNKTGGVWSLSRTNKQKPTSTHGGWDSRKLRYQRQAGMFITYQACGICGFYFLGLLPVISPDYRWLKRNICE